MNREGACPGCGMEHPEGSGPLHERYWATEACWARYGELSVEYLSDGDPAFPHQHSVDAYGAQHSGKNTPAITTAFALVGLYLALECERTGREVQLAHMELAKRKGPWPEWKLPPGSGERTVLDVLQAESGAARAEAQRAWMRDVWERWAPVQAEVRRLCAERLAAWVKEG